MDKSYKEIYKKTQILYWKNFWLYNYKAILAVSISLVVLISAAVSCAEKTRPDINIFYVSKSGLAKSVIENVEQSLAGYIEDLNGDGKKTVNFMTLAFPENTTAEIESANIAKLNIEIISGDSNIIIAEKEIIRFFLEQEDFFALPPKSNYPYVLSSKGLKVATDITNSEFAKMLGYKNDDILCLAIKEVSEDMTTEEQKKSITQEQKIIMEILK